METECDGDKIALTYPTGRHPNALLQLQKQARKRGAVLRIYDAGKYNRHPDLERNLIERLRDSGVTGVGLFASPVPPTNTDLYAKLRGEGMKVALLAPPKYDVAGEAVFLPNHRRGGYLAVNELHKRGFDHFVFTGARDLAAYKDWVVEGARHAGLELGVSVQDLREKSELDEESPRIENQEITEWMGERSQGTALFAFKSHKAVMLEQSRQKLSPAQRSNLCVLSCFLKPCLGFDEIPRIRYDFPTLLTDCVDYLLNDSISSDTLVHEWADPIFKAGYIAS